MSITVLLVDDESWVIESFKASIDWTAHGFEIIGTANSGVEALSYMDTCKPAVVFTDIRMPGMNGLELIKRGKEILPDTDFVVVSGYAEFAYAQKALTYGAIAYCLKPFEEEEIESILCRIKGKRASNSIHSTTIETLLLSYMEEPSMAHETELLEMLHRLGVIESHSSPIGVLVCSTSSLEPPIVSAELPYAKIGRMKHAFLVPHDQLEPLRISLETLHQTHTQGEHPKRMEGIRGIGVSERSIEQLDLRRAIKEANELADQYFIAGRFVIARKQTSLTESFKGELKQLDEAMRTGDVAGAHHSFDRMLSLFEQGVLTVLHALQLYHVVHAFLYCINQDHEDMVLFNREQLIANYGSVQAMIHELRQSAARSILDAQEIDLAMTSNETFRSILQYVNQHFTEDISLQSLSQLFYTNPSYISQLFKKEIGETFTAYIAKLRMTYACELLGSTDLMVGEIAERSGYMDYFYFTKMFKKLIGKTPSQFRTEMR
ncbi:response regulator transcription factor [Paenibacillus sp. 1001270B_150601_E10]|uniref:response regulator transcription factor n=1 Tax=Paenibacillus sp. 1001270B_150601_E10 TaxID=2787079 RepID=UPI00189F238C|nr:response regulator [Paenibacillus sp. 1001270B_150601_E10]